MKMEVFEYMVYAKKEMVAGFNDLERATKYAFKVSQREQCDTDVVNALTGEIHKSYCCQVHIVYNIGTKKLKKACEVKEREW